jgi:hypothetical protein
MMNLIPIDYIYIIVYSFAHPLSSSQEILKKKRFYHTVRASEASPFPPKLGKGRPEGCF